jgi:hypothetical protein
MANSDNTALNPPPINTPITMEASSAFGVPWQNRPENSDHPAFQSAGLSSSNLPTSWSQWFSSLWNFLQALPAPVSPVLFGSQATSNPWFGAPAGSRSLGVVYQNLLVPARPIFVNVGILLGASGISQAKVGLANPPIQIVSIVSNPATSGADIAHGFMVPTGAFYEVTNVGGITVWAETA